MDRVDSASRLRLLSEDAPVFSSDYNCNRLLYSTRDGSIVLDGASFPTDHFRKHLKYYPPDTRVFTSTDVSGLRVWDADRMSVLYAYPGQELSFHAYSGSLVLAAIEQSTVQLYDLRSRYPTRVLRRSCVERVGWLGTDVLAMLRSGVLELTDVRTEGSILRIENVSDFVITENCCFLIISKDKNERSLCSIQRGDGGSDRYESAGIPGIGDSDGELTGSKSGSGGDRAGGRGEMVVIEKQTKYDRIYYTKYGDVIVGTAGKGLHMESPRHSLLVSAETAAVRACYVGGETGLLLMNDSIYQIETDPLFIDGNNDQ